jgi:hypothetical protein
VKNSEHSLSAVGRLKTLKVKNYTSVQYSAPQSFPTPKLSLNFSEQKISKPLPSWVACDLCSRGINQLPVDLSPASININLTRPQPARALPEVPTNPEHDHNWQREVSFEEIFSGTDLAVFAERIECGIELGGVSLD